MSSMPTSVLVAIPFAHETGFAINALRSLFTESLRQLPLGPSRVIVSHSDIAFDSQTGDHLDKSLRWRPDSPTSLRDFSAGLSAHNVKLMLGLDLPARGAIYRSLQPTALECIVSYLGAPSGSIRSTPSLLLRKLELALLGTGADHFIYETEAMRQSGVNGRGIPLSMTSVVPLGVDTALFRPDPLDHDYVFRVFGIPAARKVFFYSGHFEERKGVRIIVEAMRILVDEFGRTDVHVVLCGDRPGERDPFERQLEGTIASGHVTFGGYRQDIERLHRGCVVGIIASTGWDSMTMSSIEMQASGLPLLVSDLQGLPETIENSVTGQTFPPGDSRALASRLLDLIGSPDKLATMSRAARTRAVLRFDRPRQTMQLSCVIDQAWSRARQRVRTGHSRD
jgi:glycosyltransferase involved in cell wall biosynthesis